MTDARHSSFNPDYFRRQNLVSLRSSICCSCAEPNENHITGARCKCLCMISETFLQAWNPFLRFSLFSDWYCSHFTRLAEDWNNCANIATVFSRLNVHYGYALRQQHKRTPNASGKTISASYYYNLIRFMCLVGFSAMLPVLRKERTSEMTSKPAAPAPPYHIYTFGLRIGDKNLEQEN